MDCKATCTIGANIAKAAFVGPETENYDPKIFGYIEKWDKYAKNYNLYELQDEIANLIDGYKNANEAVINFLRKHGRITALGLREKYNA